MPKFTASGFRAIEAETISEAARLFAARQARALYGRRAYVRTLRAESWSIDRAVLTVESFVGIDRREFFDCHGRASGTPVCVGRDIRLTVSRID